jgi:NADH:ubiquinone oxidoreductase subunit C
LTFLLSNNHNHNHNNQQPTTTNNTTTTIAEMSTLFNTRTEQMGYLRHCLNQSPDQFAQDLLRFLRQENCAQLKELLKMVCTKHEVEKWCQLIKRPHREASKAEQAEFRQLSRQLFLDQLELLTENNYALIELFLRDEGFEHAVNTFFRYFDKQNHVPHSMIGVVSKKKQQLPTMADFPVLGAMVAQADDAKTAV